VIHIFFSGVSILILVVAIATRGGVPPVTGQQEEVLSESTAEPSATAEPTPSPTLEPTIIPTSTASATPRVQPTPTNSPDQASGWVYPGSSVTSLSPVLQMTVTADQKAVTDWYKSRIQTMGMNTTSFIVTSTNEKIYNKLVATGAGKKVDVIIERNSTNEPISVQVTLISQN